MIPDALKVAVKNKVGNLIRMLKLTNAENTFIGDDLIRGVSGGERKRVTIAEMIMGMSRVLILGTPHLSGLFVLRGSERA